MSSPDGTPPAHARDSAQLGAELGGDLERGLTAAQVEAARAKWGSNQLREKPRAPWWLRFIGHFGDLMVLLLIGAAVISIFLHEVVDAVAILAIVLLNGILSFVQEERAGQALAALKRMSAPLAKVIREGTLRQIPARELVPGDLVEIEAGDNIPADLRLLRVFGLQTQEAPLTGESTPVDKEALAALPADTPLGDRRNMAFFGSLAAAGKGLGLVAATGMQTELGRIAGLLQQNEEEPTPLQKRLDRLGKMLAALCGIIIVAMVIVHLVRTEFNPQVFSEIFLLAVSLGVAAVPEGLPAVVTVALALGLQRMVKRRALVRKLASVETLGSVTVICSDKTGTLTRNEMTVREVNAGGRHFDVGGAGYHPAGDFTERGDEPAVTISPGDFAGLKQALLVGQWCNNSQVIEHPEDGWRVIGDPTEGALVVAARKAGLELAREANRIVLEVPFDSQRKAMSVVVRGEDGEHRIFVKGAPESILALCTHEHAAEGSAPLADERRQEILAINAAMAGRALRVLALAYRLHPSGAKPPAAHEVERELAFVGLVGMIDPPRMEVRAAVELCRSAGIRPVMITGDHPNTAQAIARELAIARADSLALTGQELDQLSDDELTERLPRTAVYARVSAEHKLRVVQALKKSGEVAAMTGDGVNDAPAVQAADIGVAMGITGSDVTKEASDMVLADDNFATIVAAVEEGRCIYDNIEKVLLYLLSCNFGEIVLMFVSGLLNWQPPLIAIHLLWINLATDGLPALALALEPPEPGLMQRPPRRKDAPVIGWEMGVTIFVQGCLEAGVVLLAFWIADTKPGDDVSYRTAQTTAFCVLVFSELFRSFAARSRRFNFWQLGAMGNTYLVGAVILSALLQLGVMTIPGVRDVFRVEMLSASGWLLVLGLALIPVTAVELIYKRAPWRGVEA